LVVRERAKEAGETLVAGCHIRHSQPARPNAGAAQFTLPTDIFFYFANLNPFIYLAFLRLTQWHVYKTFFDGDGAMEAMINEGGGTETQRVTQVDTQTALIGIEDELLFEASRCSLPTACSPSHRMVHED
jgi:hypothetical protein